MCLLQSMLTHGLESHSFQSLHKYLLGKHNPANNRLMTSLAMLTLSASAHRAPSLLQAPGWLIPSSRTPCAGVLTPFHR